MAGKSAWTRRAVLKAGCAAGVASTATRGATSTPFSAVGITSKVARASELRDAGADFIVESVADFLVPFASEAAFAPAEARARQASLPVRGCNSFLRDPSLICIGPKADHARVLSYAEVAFARLKRIGGEFVVFGSSNARQRPEDWSKERADEQFLGLLGSLAKLARRFDVKVCVESLRQQECNYLNHIDEVVGVISRVDHPNVRVLADLFHMRVMGDTPTQLARAMPWVGAVELAELDRRTVPGVAGDDFRPYFSEIVRAGYRGLIDIEADGTFAELSKAFATVKTQAAEASRTA